MLSAKLSLINLYNLFSRGIVSELRDLFYQCGEGAWHGLKQSLFFVDVDEQDDDYLIGTEISMTMKQ